MRSMDGEDRESKYPLQAAFHLLPFLVGFFLSFRLFIMLLSVRILGTDDRTGVEISLVLNFALLLLVIFHSFGQAAYEDLKTFCLAPVKWALTFLAFAGCSLVWSATASLPAAAIFWCAMAADLAMVLVLLRTGAVYDIAVSLIKGFVWGACFIAIIAWLLPAQSDLRLGDEELLGPNQIGYLCAFSLFFAQYLMRTKQGKWGGASLILALTLLRSLSKTSILAFIVAESFLLVMDTGMTRRSKILLVLATIAVGAAFSSLLTSYLDVYTTAGSSPETLTGRLGIWAVILNEALQRPWIGHGFHSVWMVIPPFGDFEARHAHNELLQQFYAYGLVGVCMMAGIYSSFWQQVRKLPVGSLRALMSSLLLFTLMRGLTDTEPFDLSLPLWAVTLFTLLMERETTDSLPVQHAMSESEFTSAASTSPLAGTF